MSESEPFVLPGLMPDVVFADKMDVCLRTVRRWEDAGKIVVVELGAKRFIDLEATGRRLRGEDRPRSRGRGRT